MRPVPVKEIYPRGDIYARLIKNYARLHDRRYRAGTAGRLPDAASVGWPGDWEGRTLLALCLEAEALGQTHAYPDELALDIMDRLNADGYMGEIIDPLSINEQVYPSNSWLLRGLIEYCRLTGDGAARRVIDRLLDGLFLPMLPHLENYPEAGEAGKSGAKGEAIGAERGTYREWRLSSDTGCVFISLDGLTAAYGFTGREDLLPLIEELRDRFSATDWAGIPMQTHATLSCARGLVRLYGLTGDEKALDAARRVYEAYEERGMTPWYANMNWFETPSWTEPCAVIDSFILTNMLWEATDEERYLRASHRIRCALYRGQRPNGGFGCDTTGEDGLIGIRYYEAYWCCSMRGGEGLSYIARNSAYEDDGAIVLPRFTDCEFRAGGCILREEDRTLTDGTVRLTVLEGDETRTLRLYAPEGDAGLTLNGEDVPTVRGDGFDSVRVRLTRGSVLVYDTRPSLRFAPAAGERGELLMYGEEVLMGHDAGTEKPDIRQLKRTGRCEWKTDGKQYVPISGTYLMDEDKMKEAPGRIVF